MGGELRKKQKFLNTFFRLVNADLAKLTDEQKMRLAMPFMFAAFTIVSLGKLEKSERNKKVLALLPDAQKRLRVTLDQIFLLRHARANEIIRAPSIPQWLRHNGDRFILENSLPQHKGQGQVQQIVDPLDQDIFSIDVFNLFTLMNGVPINAFRYCRNPHCEKLFIWISKKPKFYCSTSCAFKDLSKQRREKLKTEDKNYLDTRAEKAHEAYVKKTQAKKAPAKVRIDRRKRQRKS